MKRLLTLSLVLLLCLSGATAGAQPFTHLIVFGDSLSDDGNLFARFGEPPAPYFLGRFSNGPVWVEYLTDQLCLPPEAVENFAFGGAKTGDGNFRVPGAPGLQTEIQEYIATAGQADPQALYVVWAGANDFFGGVDDPVGAITNAMTNIATAIGTLAALGARTVLVPNLPNLGRTPEAVATGDPAVIGGATALALGFNGALAATLDGLEAATGIEIIPLDVFAVLEGIIADPGAHGFDNVTEPCLALDFSGICAEPERHLFWDGVHPTTGGHAILAGAALRAVATPLAALDVDRARLGLRDGEERDRFRVRGRLIPDDAGDGLAPLVEDVVVVLGRFVERIPAGSFVRNDDDTAFLFRGSPGGIGRIVIRDDGRFDVRGKKLDLEGVDQPGPVAFCLWIGDDIGRAELTAP